MSSIPLSAITVKIINVNQTSEHLLQHCLTNDALRKTTWPDQTDLRTKLFGNLEELRRTAAFVRATGLDI
jgi:hypothetical protein